MVLLFARFGLLVLLSELGWPFLCKSSFADVSDFIFVFNNYVGVQYLRITIKRVLRHWFTIRGLRNNQARGYACR